MLRLCSLPTGPKLVSEEATERLVQSGGVLMVSRTLVLIGLLGGATVLAQEKAQPKPDYVTSHPECYRLLLDNDRVRVLEYTLAPGQKEGWHTHPNMVLYVIDGGTIRSEIEGGQPVDFNEIAGEAKYVAATPRHTAHNTGKTRIRILVTELK
jgi:beta-alanine degradation protein BauB